MSGVIYDGRPLSCGLVGNLGTCQFAENHADVVIVGYGGGREDPSEYALARRTRRRRLRTLYVRMPDLFIDGKEKLAAGISK